MTAELSFNDVKSVVLERSVELSTSVMRKIEIQLENGSHIYITLYSNLDDLKVEIE